MFPTSWWASWRRISKRRTLLFEIPLKAEDVPHVDACLVTHADGDHYSRETCAAA